MSQSTELVSLFKALSDENRIQILKILRNGEKCACKLLEELNIRQSTLSHHMRILCDAGIVTGRKEGKWTHYAICCNGVNRVRELMAEFLSADKTPSDCECKEG